MKKNSLSTAIAAGVAGIAGLAGMANAVNLNPDGLGQVLLYPYYTVNSQNDTLLSIVNTTNQGKAVKIRFLEALNSAEVLDFNLYLSPFDVWTASVVSTAGGASLRTTDTSCTVPNDVGKGANGTAFLPYEFQSNSPDIIGLTDLIGLGGSSIGLVDITVAERVRQGHVEAIEMGTLIDEAAPSTFRPLTWSTHGGPITARVPANCPALQTAWTAPSGAWIIDDGRAVNAPTGGLFGAGTIVDVNFGRALSYNADAIDGFYSPIGLAVEANGTTADLHFEPGSVFPNLSQARTNADGSSTARMFDNGALATATYVNGLDAVSAVLMSRFIYNEYNLEASLAAASEWVVTFPTKRLHTYGQRVGLDTRPFSDNTETGEDSDFLDGEVFDTFGICEVYTLTRYDREEFTPGVTLGPPGVSPRPPGVAAIFPQLCWESNVIAFNQTLTATTETAVLGALPTQGAHGLNINAGTNTFVTGWARIEFNHPTQAAGTFQNYLVSQDLNPVAIVGLPTIGFWAADYTNNFVGGNIRANFSGLHKHRADRDGYLLGLGAIPPAFGTDLNNAGLASWTSSSP